MKTKIILLFAIMLLATVTGAMASDIPVDTFDYGLDCYFPTTHFMKVDDGVLRINCFTDSSNLSCTTKVYNALSPVAYDEILQTNPDVIHNSRVSPFFTPENNQLNVYFNKKNLLWDKNYTYSVECSGSNGIDIDTATVTVENNKLVTNWANKIVDFKDNANFWALVFFGAIFMIIIVVILIGFLKNR